MFFFDKQGPFPRRVNTGRGLDRTQRRLEQEQSKKLWRKQSEGREIEWVGGWGGGSWRGTDEDGGSSNEEERINIYVL